MRPTTQALDPRVGGRRRLVGSSPPRPTAARQALLAAADRLLAGTPPALHRNLSVVRLAIEAQVKYWIVAQKHIDLRDHLQQLAAHAAEVAISRFRESLNAHDTLHQRSTPKLGGSAPTSNNSSLSTAPRLTNSRSKTKPSKSKPPTRARQGATSLSTRRQPREHRDPPRSAPTRHPGYSTPLIDTHKNHGRLLPRSPARCRTVEHIRAGERVAMFFEYPRCATRSSCTR